MIPSHGPRSSWLSALLEPVSVDEFISRFWRKDWLLSRGSANRFAELLSWSDFNRILEHHWRETYRFRLARQGRDLEPSEYADLEGSTPRIRPKDVTDHLRCGATLSFDAIDEVHEPLSQLASSFETCFRGATQVNVYAGWRALHGLDLHHDDEEIFILQVNGRKRWLLYGFGIDGIDRQSLEASVPPDGASFDRILTSGDLLYMPRGCYHLAVPMNEPTLHLTVGIKNPREIQLGEQRLSDAASPVQARPSFSFPWSATPGRLPPGQDFLITLHSPTHIAGGADSSTGPIAVHGRGRTYRFPRGMQCIIEALSHGEPVPFGRVIEMVATRLDEEAVRLLVAMLVSQHLVKIDGVASEVRHGER